MKIVEPIKKPSDIEKIKDLLKSKDNIRDLLLFEMGINSALRVSDILKITVSDVFDENLNPKESFRLKEQKTSKNGIVALTPKIRETLKLFKDKYTKIVSIPGNYLFFRRKKLGENQTIGSCPITPCMARRLVSKWCRMIDLKGSYGTHTLRKTRGFQARKNNIPIELIQHKLNHSSLAVTKRYLGISDEELIEACNNMDL